MYKVEGTIKGEAGATPDYAYVVPTQNENGGTHSSETVTFLGTGVFRNASKVANSNPVVGIPQTLTITTANHSPNITSVVAKIQGSDNNVKTLEYLESVRVQYTVSFNRPAQAGLGEPAVSEPWSFDVNHTWS